MGKLITGIFIVFSLIFLRFYFDKRVVLDNRGQQMEKVKVGNEMVKPEASGNRVKIGDDIFFVEIADSTDELERGLSNRQSLDPDRGMLFIFGTPDRHGFWMKDMLFSIDIVWLHGKSIVGIAESLPLDKSAFPKVYYPPEFVDRVIEVKAGEIRARGIKVGEEVEYLLE